MNQDQSVEENGLYNWFTPLLSKVEIFQTVS